MGHGEPEHPERLTQGVGIPGLTIERAIYAGSFLMVAAVWQLVQLTDTVGTLLDVMSLTVLAGLGWFLLFRCSKVERERMFVLILLTLSTVVFWALFEQGAGSMTLYADRVTDKTLFGMTLTAAQFGAANSFFIFSLAPLFALLWIRLGQRGWEPSTPVKFSLGIAQAGLGFGALVYGAQFPDQAGVVSAWWLIVAYLLHTTGELCLSPVGLSAVTKLAATLRFSQFANSVQVLGPEVTTPRRAAGCAGCQNWPLNAVGAISGAGRLAAVHIMRPVVRCGAHLAYNIGAGFLKWGGSGNLISTAHLIGQWKCSGGTVIPAPRFRMFVQPCS